MKHYIASVKDETGKYQCVESDYNNKKDFARDLRANGYSVCFISTPEKFDEDCEKYHERLATRRLVGQLNRDSKKKIQQATEMLTKQREEQEVLEYEVYEEYYKGYYITGTPLALYVAVDPHGHYSPEIFETVEDAKKAIDKDIANSTPIESEEQDTADSDCTDSKAPEKIIHELISAFDNCCEVDEFYTEHELADMGLFDKRVNEQVFEEMFYDEGYLSEYEVMKSVCYYSGRYEIDFNFEVGEYMISRNS